MHGYEQHLMGLVVGHHIHTTGGPLAFSAFREGFLADQARRFVAVRNPVNSAEEGDKQQLITGPLADTNTGSLSGSKILSLLSGEPNRPSAAREKLWKRPSPQTVVNFTESAAGNTPKQPGVGTSCRALPVSRSTTVTEVAGVAFWMKA